MSSEPKAVATVEDVLALIDDYWCLAYAEGKEGRTQDTEQGDAQRCRTQIEQALAALRADVLRLDRDNDALMIERDALRAQVEALRKALAIAIRQNSHDMLMTGEEIRLCQAAMEKTA